MLKIRLSRIGKKKKPVYRIIVSEAARDPYGKALEILGTYNPFTKELLKIKKERIEYWLGHGAQMTPSANNLLVEKKVIKGEKVNASKAGKKKKGAKEEKKDDEKTKDEAPKEEKTTEKSAE